jgi:hypothetical protein
MKITIKQNYNVQARNQLGRGESNCAGQESGGPARKLTMIGGLSGANPNIDSDGQAVTTVGAGMGPHA